MKLMHQNRQAFSHNNRDSRKSKQPIPVKVAKVRAAPAARVS
jgi:hypothetical protein